MTWNKGANPVNNVSRSRAAGPAVGEGLSDRRVKKTVHQKQRPADRDQIFHERHKKIRNAQTSNRSSASVVTGKRSG
jgi:hypothetical protein